MSVNVRSIPAIREFRAAVITFADELRVTLETIQMELQRAFEWIETDRPQYWQRDVRRAFDLVAATRAALNTCLARTVAGRKPSCIEEKQAYEAARRRLRFSEEQIERVKRTAIRIRHDANEFRGQLSALRRLQDRELPELLKILHRTAVILESYAEMEAPAEESGSRTRKRPELKLPDPKGPAADGTSTRPDDGE